MNKLRHVFPLFIILLLPVTFYSNPAPQSSSDVNVNGSLTYEEFTATAKARASVVSIRRNFFRADLNADSNVTLAEWLVYRRGDAPRNIYTVFELADFDENDELTPEEYGYFFARGTASAKILARFSSKDDNDDGVLTRDEWNPGGPRNFPL